MVEEFYRDLYRSSNNSDENDGGRGTDEFDIPNVTKGEDRKALAAMKRGKAAEEDQVTADPLKNGGGDRGREIRRPIYRTPQDLDYTGIV